MAKPKFDHVLTRDYLLDAYVDKQMSTLDIAKSVGCGDWTVRSYLKKHAITPRSYSASAAIFRKRTAPVYRISKDYLQQEFVERRRPAVDLAKELGCSFYTVTDALRHHGFDPLMNMHVRSASGRELHAQPLAVKEAYDSGTSLAALARRYRVGTSTIKRYLLGLGVKLRTQSEQARIDCRQTAFRIARSAAAQGIPVEQWRDFSSHWRIRAENRPEYKMLRKSVYSRDKFTCQECGKRGGRLQLHHIVPVKNRGELMLELQNCITLCGPCHHKTQQREHLFYEKYAAITGLGRSSWAQVSCAP
jgi:transposase